MLSALSFLSISFAISISLSWVCLPSIGRLPRPPPALPAPFSRAVGFREVASLLVTLPPPPTLELPPLLNRRLWR